MAAITPTIDLLIGTTPALDPTALEFGDATTGKFGTGKFAASSNTVAITGDVQSVQIRRGRDTFTGRSDPGTCSITLRNDRTNAGDYDPLNTASPYYPLLSSASIQVLIGGIALYTGDITGIAISEAPPRQSVVTFDCKERSSRFSTTRTTYLQFDGALISANVERAILAADHDATITMATRGTDVSAPDPFDVSDIKTLIAVDELIGDIECTDGGMFSVQGDGSYLYIGPTDLIELTSSLTVSDQAAATVKYSSVERGSVFDRVTNVVTFHRTWTANPGITNDWPTDDDPQWLEPRSTSKYGVHELQCNIYPTAGLDISYVTPIADRILAYGAYPQETIVGVTIPTHRYGVLTQAVILAVDIGQVITVARTPPGASASSVAYLVIGVEHDMSPKQHTTTFRLAPQPT